MYYKGYYFYNKDKQGWFAFESKHDFSDYTFFEDIREKIISEKVMSRSLANHLTEIDSIDEEEYKNYLNITS